MTDHVDTVARRIAADLGQMVNDDQISPPEVMVGNIRGGIAFWMGCVRDGTRADALASVRQVLNEEIDNMVRGIANGMVPA